MRQLLIDIDLGLFDNDLFDDDWSIATLDIWLKEWLWHRSQCPNCGDLAASEGHAPSVKEKS